MVNPSICSLRGPVECFGFGFCLVRCFYRPQGSQSQDAQIGLAWCIFPCPKLWHPCSCPPQLQWVDYDLWGSGGLCTASEWGSGGLHSCLYIFVIALRPWYKNSLSISSVLLSKTAIIMPFPSHSIFHYNFVLLQLLNEKLWLILQWQWWVHLWTDVDFPCSILARNQVMLLCHQQNRGGFECLLCLSL